MNWKFAALLAALTMIGGCTPPRVEVIPPPKSHDDMKVLGDWNVESIKTHVALGAVYSGINPGRSITFVDDKLISWTTKKDEPDETYRVKIDPWRQPKWIDLETTKDVATNEGASKEKVTYPGIYEFRGDEFWICYSTEPKGPEDRPKSFEWESDARRLTLLVLKRKSK